MSHQNNILFAEERQKKILEMLNVQKKLLVQELCDYFNVSPATIRNDLRDLSSEGLLTRTHGGAIKTIKKTFEPDTSQKQIQNANTKEIIAKYAATLVDDGDTIAIDTGTTMMFFAMHICQKKNLTVVLNDIQIALYLENNSDANIVLTGGILRKNFHCTIGPLATSALNSLSVDKAFMATNGLDSERGLTTPDIHQAEVKKSFIKTASEIFLICDSSKIGTVSFSKFADINDFSLIITDYNIPTKLVYTLKDKGCDIYIVTE